MAEIKILHIANDEKFINAANWLFEQAFPNSNTFFVLLQENKKTPQYVEPKPNIVFYNKKKDTLKQVIKKLNEFDLVVLHGLYYFQSRLVLKKHKTTKFIWILFGGEIYNNPYIFGKGIYGSTTFNLFLNKNHYHLKNSFRPFFYLLTKGKLDSLTLVKRAAIKVNTIGILHKEDYNLFLKKKMINKDAEHLIFTYYPIEFIFKNNEDLLVNGDNILLGNSASYTNNHLEAFELLEKLELGSRKIITPLSYGNEEYAEYIVNAGQIKFGDNFNPLIDFMKLEEYNKVVSSCGITIMNHYRQQAVGNVLAMLWMGSKVFLDERNTVYHYLKRIGCKVFSITKDLNPENMNVFKPLLPVDVKTNREILLKEISTQRIVNNLRKELLTISNSK